VTGVVERKGPGGRVRDPNPREDWIITANTHQALVSRSVFDAVQDQRRKRDASGKHLKHPRGRGYYSNYLLSGLIRCGDCDHKFMGYAQKSRTLSKTRPSPAPASTSAAGTSRRSFGLQASAYEQEPLEAFILGRLQSRLEAFLQAGGEKVLRQMIREAIAATGANPKQTLAEVRTEIAGSGRTSTGSWRT